MSGRGGDGRREEVHSGNKLTLKQKFFFFFFVPSSPGKHEKEGKEEKEERMKENGEKNDGKW